MTYPPVNRSDRQKSNRARFETILYTVLQFQIDRACFQGKEASTNFGGKEE